MSFTSRIAAALGLGLGAASLPATVGAASPAFTGLAAVADDAEGALTNPAGMTRLDRPTTSLGALVAQGFGSFEVDQQRTTVDGGDPDNSNDPIAIPSAYYVRPVGDRWRVGISLTVPSGFGSDNGGRWAGRYYSDSYSLVYVALTPAVAWRVDEHWSVGLGVGINYTLSSSEVGLPAPGARRAGLPPVLRSPRRPSGPPSPSGSTSRTPACRSHSAPGSGRTRS